MHKISWTGPRLFVMVGANDNPIYEHSFVTQKERLGCFFFFGLSVHEMVFCCGFVFC
jgi:hypothetical protein